MRMAGLPYRAPTQWGSVSARCSSPSRRKPRLRVTRPTSTPSVPATPKWSSAERPSAQTKPGLITKVAVLAMDAARVTPTKSGPMSPSPIAKLAMLPLVRCIPRSASPVVTTR